MNEKRLHILIVSYLFPPHYRVSARRPYYMARNFTNIGHKVTVLTTFDPPGSLSSWKTNLKDIDVIRVPIATSPKDYSIFSRFFFWLYHTFKTTPILNKLIRNICFFLLPMDHHLLMDLHHSRKVKSLEPDVIVATGGPWSIFETGRLLSKRMNIPLFLDYRDAWSIYHKDLEFGELHDMGKGAIGYLKRTANKVREQRFGKQATGITAVSAKMLANCAQASGVQNGTVIMNGYGDEPVPQPSGSSNNKMTITFTGIINRNQVLDVLIAGVELLQNNYPEIYNQVQFNLLGILSSNPQNLSSYTSCPLKEDLNATPYIDLNECIDIQNSSDVLLCLGLRGTKGVPGSKIYEYLKAHKPILLLSESDDGRESIIKRTNSGYICRTPEEFVQIVTRLFELWNSSSGIEFSPVEKEVAIYSYGLQVQRFSDFILRSIN